MFHIINHSGNAILRELWLLGLLAARPIEQLLSRLCKFFPT